MTRQLRLFPLNSVLFPGAVLNLHIFEPRYKQMIAECLEAGEGFGVALIADGAESGDPAVQPHDIGSIAEIVDVQPLPFGRYYISTVGRARFRIREVIAREPYLIADVELIEEPQPPPDREIDELLPAVRELFEEYLALLVAFSGQESAIDLPDDAASTSFLIGDALQVAERVKQRLLELHDTKSRLRAEFDFLERLLPQLRHLLERRRRERQVRRERGEDHAYRADQEKFFGKFFSLN
ncbi:MAG TPA: LON peptidase substrate-binding domain-containing protein [Candidatus Aquilonibacter sp.]